MWDWFYSLTIKYQTPSSDRDPDMPAYVPDEGLLALLVQVGRHK